MVTSARLDPLKNYSFPLLVILDSAGFKLIEIAISSFKWQLRNRGQLSDDTTWWIISWKLYGTWSTWIFHVVPLTGHSFLPQSMLGLNKETRHLFNDAHFTWCASVGCRLQVMWFQWFTDRCGLDRLTSSRVKPENGWKKRNCAANSLSQSFPEHSVLIKTDPRW